MCLKHPQKPDFDATKTRMDRASQGGFTLVTGIFLLVILAALAAFLVSVSGLFQMSAVLDMQSSRAYQAARAGIEWGAFNTLTPPAVPACPATTHLTFPTTGLSDFTTTVSCTLTSPTDSGVTVNVYQITSTACNQPTGGACPWVGTPGANYVERQLSVTLAR